MKKLKWLILAVPLLFVLGYIYWKFAIPTHRVETRSELVMVGDLDGDNHWTAGDINAFDSFLKEPSTASDMFAMKTDLNRNSLIDEEDLTILRALVGAGGDPYAAEDAARSSGKAFPRPRELYRYMEFSEYYPRPLWALPYSFVNEPGLEWLSNLHLPTSTNTYSDKLDADLFSEAVRLDQAWRKREPTLLPIERDYARMKFTSAKKLFEAGERYELLLALMDLVEDAETLTALNQPDISLKLLLFRDHLRAALNSPQYTDFEADKQSWQPVLKTVSGYLQTDLGMNYDLEKLGPPRNMTHLENYLQRVEWQYYKSTRSDDDFLALIRYAQNDPRYLRAVSRTSRKLRDVNVENHNLPMVLLFREALRIESGDKKKAVGLLDEAIRIPYAWIKTIPREVLPSSLALDNFLLPGNKEDGADKSRHWNVFGGICLYKSPQEALDLALKREIQDLKDDGYSKEAMREFFRDLIGDLNGMYHVMTVNPELLTAKSKQAP